MGLGFSVSDDYLGAGTGHLLDALQHVVDVGRAASRVAQERSTGLRFRANFRWRDLPLREGVRSVSRLISPKRLFRRCGRVHSRLA